jgi:hypothetical protein
MHKNTIDSILQFLDSIGLPYRLMAVGDTTFLPGLDIADGVLLIDKNKLLYPGDILHEAGHIAVLEPAKRKATTGNAGVTSGYVDGEEIAAILWSYAALKKIGLPEETVFHEAGYKGGSDWHIENFQNGTYPGLALLEWMGLTVSDKNAKASGTLPFPNMIKWIRE